MMTIWESSAFWGWLADYYVFASLILIASVAGRRAIKQPARRLAASWSVAVGLLALLGFATAPSWPKVCVIAPRPALSEAPPALNPGSAAPRSSTLTASAAPESQPGPAQELGRIVEAATTVDVERYDATGPGWRSLDSWARVLGAAFGVGSALMMAWLALGARQAAALKRRSRPAPENVTAALARIISREGSQAGRAGPELRISDALRQPVALGVLRPTIILPSRFLELGEGPRLEAALAHEWAHVRNRDLWLIAILRLLLPILYAHPLYWRLRAGIRDDQEAMADASAAAIEGRLNYAQILLSWSQESQDVSRGPRLASGGAVAFFERPSQMKRRILMLLDEQFRMETACPRGWRRAFQSAMALAVLAVSTLTLRATAVNADGAGAGAGGSIVLTDPSGQPVSGAKIYLSGVSKPRTAVLLSTTGTDGLFPRRKLSEAEQRFGTRIIATADGYGPAFADSKLDQTNRLTLVPDDVPIRGRIHNAMGQPIPGASVQVVAVFWRADGKLDAWLAKMEADKEVFPALDSELNWWATDDVASFYAPAVADRDGRFTIRGLGRERAAALLISGPNLGTKMEYVATRRMQAITYPDYKNLNHVRNVVCRGAECEITVGPGLEAEGSVVDHDTGAPLAGAIVQTAAMFGNPLRTLQTTSDAQGRFRLTGIPLQTSFNDSQDLLVRFDEQSYLPAVKTLGKHQAPAKVTVDFQIKRGVRVKGRVVDTATGEGVPSGVSYYILSGNPHQRTYAKFGTPRITSALETDDQGRFELVVMPGPGVIAARSSRTDYRMGVGVETIPALEWADPDHLIAQTAPTLLVPSNYHAMIGIDPQAGDKTLDPVIKLDRGRSVSGQIVGLDGQPLAGALIEGLDDFRRWSRNPLKTANFSAVAIAPDADRELLALHEAKNLAGAYTIKAGESGPIALELSPAGSVVGRLVDAAGAPMAEVDLTCDAPRGAQDALAGSLPSPIATGSDGRFRAVGLIPGRTYRFRIWRGNQVQDVAEVAAAAGETKDLGDVIPKPSR